MGQVTDSFGRWRGPDLATWLERVARPAMREGETLPWIKPSVITRHEAAAASRASRVPTAGPGLPETGPAVTESTSTL